jgi:hypothetical protein
MKGGKTRKEGARRNEEGEGGKIEDGIQKQEREPKKD